MAKKGQLLKSFWDKTKKVLFNQTIEFEFSRTEIDKLQLENEQVGILNEELVKHLSEETNN